MCSKMCANGRTESPVCEESIPLVSGSYALRTSEIRLVCESITPFGVPVVPEV